MVLMAISVFLFAFSNWKNETRKIAEITVDFKGSNNLFLTQNSVSKLLIQNQKGLTDKAKRIIDLNDLEAVLKSHKMVRKAEVFMSLDGEITAEIEQKSPLARVVKDNYYIDDTGSWMPLSDTYTARVPLVTGVVKKSSLEELFVIAKRINNDEFLREHITEIQQNVKSDFELRLRSNNTVIELGDTSELDKKFNNLKAFYQKATSDGILNKYRKLNLRFTSQVICTKK